MKRILELLTVIAFAVPFAAAAQVTASDAWVRGTVQGQRTTGAFMKLAASVDTSLVAASSPVAKIVEIHQMSMDGGMMKMRAVERLPIAAGKTVELAPSGYHIMLMALTQPMKVGESIPITLTFEDRAGKRSQVEVKATVRPLAAGPSGKPN